jgi:hypothetical protein
MISVAVLHVTVAVATDKNSFGSHGAPYVDEASSPSLP